MFEQDIRHGHRVVVTLLGDQMLDGDGGDNGHRLLGRERGQENAVRNGRIGDGQKLTVMAVARPACAAGSFEVGPACSVTPK